MPAVCNAVRRVILTAGRSAKIGTAHRSHRVTLGHLERAIAGGKILRQHDGAPREEKLRERDRAPELAERGGNSSGRDTKCPEGVRNALRADVSLEGGDPHVQESRYLPAARAIGKSPAYTSPH